MRFYYHALRWILESPTSPISSNIHVIDYSDRRTFENLWLNGLLEETVCIDGRLIQWKDTNVTLCIVGNAPPPGYFSGVPDCVQGINFSSHFTATSWVAAWKLRFTPSDERNLGLAQDQLATVLVLDHGKHTIPTGAARSLGTLFDARNRANESLIPRCVLLLAPELTEIASWISSSNKDFRRTTANLRELLRATIWAELVSEREHHHALSNVLGALLLMAQVGPPGLLPEKFKLPVQELLLSLVRACGVKADWRRGEARPESDRTPAWINKSMHATIDGAVLLDDMSELWTPFLAVALALYGPSYTRFVASPVGSFCAMLRGLPQRLQAVLARGENARISAADVIPGDHALQEQFVLFLDLRLFSTVEAKSQEKAFYHELARFGIGLLHSSRNLPWVFQDASRLSLQVELERIQQGELPEHRETLLARLVALLDPTLPIVIFSSTHRSELIDPFRDYGNIITAFRKPALSGMTADWGQTVSELKAEFIAAIEQAGRINRVRRAFLRLPSQTRIEASFAAPKALEIFIDESYYRKTNVYSIGCVVLLGESHASIRNLCKAMEDAGIQWGISVNNRNNYIKESRRLAWNGNRLECAKGWIVNRQALPAPGKFLKKFASNEEQRATWDKIKRLAEDKRVKIFTAALGAPVTARIGWELGIPSLQGVGRDQADELHRELAKSLLLLLFTAHPEVSAALRVRNASVAIDVGTRTAVPESYDSRHEETYQRFGLAYTDHGLNSPTLKERCDMWNMAINWARRQDWWNRGEIEARVVGERITPDERDLAQWTDTIIWAPRRKMISVSSYDGLNYLRETFARLSPTVLPNIVRARGCALFDFEDTGDWLVKLYCFPCFPYQPHYLADWIARCGVYATGAADEESALQDAFSSGFLAEWGAFKKDLLNAILDMNGTNTVEGFRGMVAWMERHGKSTGGCRATDLLLMKAHEATLKVHGNVLRGLFAGLG